MHANNYLLFVLLELNFEDTIMNTISILIKTVLVTWTRELKAMSNAQEFILS
jgi:hypothetical protein